MRNLHDLPREKPDIRLNFKDIKFDNLISSYETMRSATERMQRATERLGQQLTGINNDVYLNLSPIYGIPIANTAIDIIPRTQEFTLTGTYNEAVLAENPVFYQRLDDNDWHNISSTSNGVYIDGVRVNE